MINEFRRARRRKAADTILVVDAMTERVVGRIGNLSETGMLLMAYNTWRTVRVAKAAQYDAAAQIA